jgi:hypothetical protein
VCCDTKSAGATKANKCATVLQPSAQAGFCGELGGGPLKESAAQPCHADAPQVLAELTAAEAVKAAAVAGAQLLYAQAAARLRTMQASADQRVRRAARASSLFWTRGLPLLFMRTPARACRCAHALRRARAAPPPPQAGPPRLLALSKRCACASSLHLGGQLVGLEQARHSHPTLSITYPCAARGAQDSLAEGMHLIDFEQLKMENAALREKIEERGDEVARLRRKTHATVQASRPAGRPGSASRAPQSWLWRMCQAWRLVRAMYYMRWGPVIRLCSDWCLGKGWRRRIVCALKGTMPALTTARSPGIPVLLSSCRRVRWGMPHGALRSHPGAAA